MFFGLLTGESSTLAKGKNRESAAIFAGRFWPIGDDSGPEAASKLADMLELNSIQLEEKKAVAMEAISCNQTAKMK